MLRQGSIRRMALCLLLALCVSGAAGALPGVAGAAAKHHGVKHAKKHKTKKKAHKKARKPVSKKAKAASPAPNSGLPGSACVGEPFSGSVPGPDASLDTASFGSAAPAHYEIGKPTDFPDNLYPAKRVMMIIHGGGWFLAGDETLRAEHDSANKWRAVGWETVNVDYRACAQSLPDVLAFYDLTRAKFGPKVPICIAGQSAGAHLALMIAAERGDVACVIAEGAPTDFASMVAQGVAEARNGSAVFSLGEGAGWAVGLARAAYGRDALASVSPVNFASSIRARVLLGTAQNDSIVPYQQAQELESAIHAVDPNRYVDVDRLAAGNVYWTHADVSQAASDEFDQRAAALVKPWGRAPGKVTFSLPGLFNLFSPSSLFGL